MNGNNNILGNELQVASTSAEESFRDTRKEIRGIEVFSGEALTDFELYRKSAQTDVEMIVIAGPSGCGKTTMGLMMYYFFAEGLNRRIQFASSDTIIGYRKRSKPLLYNSGNDSPSVDRTLHAENRKYFHMKLVNFDGKRKNFIFTDFAGELYTDNEKLQEVAALLEQSHHVILLVDGKGLIKNKDREKTRRDTLNVMDVLLRNHVITNNTMLQVVCSKKDLIERLDNKQIIWKEWERLMDVMKRSYGKTVPNMEFRSISVLEIENEVGCMEEIMQSCFRETDAKKNVARQEYEPFLERMFERFRAERVLCKENI